MGSDSNEDDSNSIDVDSEEEDLCVGLTQTECGGIVRDDGDAECAYNAVTGDCYDIERREGRLGRGNFDDGYNTARQKADDEQAQLELLVYWYWLSLAVQFIFGRMEMTQKLITIKWTKL